MSHVVAPDGVLDRVVNAGRKRLVGRLQSASTTPTVEQMMKEPRFGNDPASTQPRNISGRGRPVFGGAQGSPPEITAGSGGTRRTALRLHNHTHIHLKDVQVRLELPDGVLALPPTDPDDRDKRKPFSSGLPKAPRPYGPVKRAPYSPCGWWAREWVKNFYVRAVWIAV